MLGQGGFGITYRATDAKLGIVVAIKEFFLMGSGRSGHDVLPPPASEEQFAVRRERFRQEARALARFRHPGIVRVFEFFDENNTVYMVMEHLEGRSLRQVMRMAGGRIQQDMAVTYILQVADALAAVHAGRLLHRDIKPDNVLVLDNGSAVLIDFGTARQFSASEASRFTQMLSPGYAPLEQYGESGHFGPSTDIYALGATLYELVTGQAPTASPQRVAGVPLAEPRELNPGLSPEVDQAIQWAMDMDPANRPQTVAAFADALRGASPPAAAAAHPAVTPVTPVTPAAPPPGDDATRPVTPAAVAAVPGAEAPLPAASASGGRNRWMFGLIGLGVLAAVVTAVVLALSRSDSPPPTTGALPPVSTTTTTSGSTTTVTAAATTTVVVTQPTTTATPGTTAPPITLDPQPFDVVGACLDYPFDFSAPRISFAEGGISSQVDGFLPDNGFAQYLIRVLGGQTVFLVADSPDGSVPAFLLCVRGTDDGFVQGGIDALASTPLPLNQDYQLTVAALGQGGQFRLDTLIPPPPSGTLVSGLFCRDLAAQGYGLAESVAYWVREGRPDRMDADGNGIPCETVFDISQFESYFFVVGVEPAGLLCADLAARGWFFVDALAYWVAYGGPERMDSDGDGVPCETIYSGDEIGAVLFFDG